MRDVSRVEWMSKGKYGMMIHYLPCPENGNLAERIKEYNKIVDNFNIDSFMKSFDESGADWLIFTLGQCTGFWSSYCEPIEDRIKGVCSKRDLSLEISKAVKSRGKHFINYIPGECFYLIKYHPEFKDIYKHTKEDNGAEFIKLWREVYRYYSDKFGALCDGWWIDGCYEDLHHNTWNWEDLANQLRHGNPNSALGFSDGSFCIDKFTNISNENDYFPGECHFVEKGIVRHECCWYCGHGELCQDGIVRFHGNEPKYFTPKEKYIDNSLLHVLCNFDSAMNPDLVEREWVIEPASVWAKLVNDFNRVGGAVTFNVAGDKFNNGIIDKEYIDKFAKMGTLVK